jgi:hypothetical protein
MVRYVVEEWAPLLDIGEIEPTTFVVPHMVFGEPTTAMDMIESMAVFGGDHSLPLDWAVWEKRSFHMFSPGQRGTTWRTRYDEGAEASSSGPDAQQMLNGAYVTYDDGTGTQRSVGPPGSGADFETASLIDISDSNPVNRDGAKHWQVINAGITSQAGAVLIGQLVLADRNNMEWRGEVRVVDQVRDEAGNWHPVGLVRAADYIVIEDDPDTRPRRIVNTKYNSPTRTNSLSVGARPDRLDTLLARIGVVLGGRLN